MREESLKFFQDAISTPSPSGYEERIQQLVRNYISPYTDSERIDVHGNLIASIGEVRSNADVCRTLRSNRNAGFSHR